MPPLKIVIPQSSTSEQDTGTSRNGKNSSQRSHQALPYVVASSNNDIADKENTSGTSSPTESSKTDDKKETNSGNSEEQVGVHFFVAIHLLSEKTLRYSKILSHRASVYNRGL